MSVALRGTPVGDFLFAATTTITKQSGLQVGDLLIWMVDNSPSGPAATINIPSGWTQIDTINITGSNRTVRHSVFWRIVDGSEGATFTASGSSPGSDAMASIMSAYTGANQTTPIDTYSINSGSSSGTTITATGITVTGSGGLLVGCLAVWETDRGPLSTMSEVLNSGGSGLTLDNVASSPGATGNLTCACSATEVWSVFLISVSAASGGAGGAASGGAIASDQSVLMPDVQLLC